MNDNTAHQGARLFLLIWPKIKACSLLRALHVSKANDLWRDTFDFHIRALVIFYFVFFWRRITCAWYSGGRCPPRGWRDELGCSIVPHVDGTLITQRPGGKTPSGPGQCTAEGTDHWLHKSIIPHTVQQQPEGQGDKRQLSGVVFRDNQNPWTACSPPVSVYFLTYKKKGPF